MTQLDEAIKQRRERLKRLLENKAKKVPQTKMHENDENALEGNNYQGTKSLKKLLTDLI